MALGCQEGNQGVKRLVSSVTVLHRVNLVICIVTPRLLLDSAISTGTPLLSVARGIPMALDPLAEEAS